MYITYYIQGTTEQLKKKMFTTCRRHCCMYILYILLLYNMGMPNISLVRGYNIKAVYITLLPVEARNTRMIFLLLYEYILIYSFILLYYTIYTILHIIV